MDIKTSTEEVIQEVTYEKVTFEVTHGSDMRGSDVISDMRHLPVTANGKIAVMLAWVTFWFIDGSCVRSSRSHTSTLPSCLPM